MPTSKLQWYIWNEWLTWSKALCSWRSTNTAQWACTYLFSELWKSTIYILKKKNNLPHISFLLDFGGLGVGFLVCFFLGGGVVLFAVFSWRLVSWYSCLVFLGVVILFSFSLFSIFKASLLSMYVCVHSDPWQSKIWFRLDYIKTQSLSKVFDTNSYYKCIHSLFLKCQDISVGAGTMACQWKNLQGKTVSCSQHWKIAIEH